VTGSPRFVAPATQVHSDRARIGRRFSQTGSAVDGMAAAGVAGRAAANSDAKTTTVLDGRV